jgi:hypothetical protein
MMDRTRPVKWFYFLIGGFVVSTALGVGSYLDIHLEEETGCTVVILSWSVGSEPEPMIEGRDLLLRFSEPFEIRDPLSLQPADSSSLESIVQGYDTLLIRAGKPVNFVVKTEGKNTTIQLEARSGLEGHPSGRGAELRLDLLKAELLTKTGRLKEADSLLRHLREEHPESPEVLGSLASLESSLQLNRKASEHYQQALGHQPENEDFAEALEVLESPRKPRVGFSFESKTVTKAQDERIAGIEAESRLSPYTTLGFEYETNQVEIDSVRLADGSISSFRGTRRRSELFLSYLPESGGILKTSVLADGSSIGAGLRFQRPDYLGSSEVAVDYKRLNWDFVEGIVSRTTRDRIQLRRIHRIEGGLSILGSFAGNRYHTSIHHSAASSVGFEAVGRYQLDAFPISFEYGIESEYRISSKTLTDELGLVYSPVPLISREIHFVDTSFWKKWNSSCWTDGFAGYSVDRLGGSGPFAGVKLRCEPRQGLGGTIWFDQRLHTVDTSQIVLRLGGTLFWRF